jgi:hypothetical protein
LISSSCGERSAVQVLGLHLVFVIDSIARPLVLLDANAVRYCFKRDGFATAECDQLRKVMGELARLDLIRFIITTPVGWELTQVHFEESPQAYADLIEFYFAIGKEWAFWYGESFYLAKILSVFVDTKKQLTSKNSIKAMPDLMDATHFRDAAYSHVLVTQDANFRTVASMARTGLRIVSFDEFARNMLAHAQMFDI